MQITAQLAHAMPGIGKAGETVQFSLSPNDVHEAEEMDTYLAGYKPEGFRADEAVPEFLVDKATDKFRSFNENDAYLVVETRTARQAGLQEIDPSTSLETYLVEEHGLASFIPKATEAQSEFDVKAGSSRRIAWGLALGKEDRVFGSTGLLTTASNWNPNNVVTVGAGTAKWSALTTADPIGDLQNIIRKSAQKVTDIWMPEPVSHNFMRCVSVREHLRTHLGDGATAKDVQDSTDGGASLDYRIPGLPAIRVCAQKKKDTASGLLTYIFDNQVVLTSNPGTPTDGQTIQTCIGFRERKDSGNGLVTREFPIEQRGLEGGNMMVSGYAEDLRMVGTNVGGLLEAVNS